MYDDRMERACALICLLSSLCAIQGDPQPMTRRTVRRMIACGALDGHVLRDSIRISPEQMARAQALLSKGSSVFARLEQYREMGFELLLPHDAAWPRPLEKLGEQMPHYLFALGNVALLRGELVAAAGSRAILRETRHAAARIGAALAAQGMTIVTGGAQGVDTAVQRAALENGGSVVIVPALPVSELLKSVSLQKAVADGRALILCETPPDEPFSAQKALLRNHTIYALGSKALVVAARAGKGGSWSGAKACIKGRWTPVYALDQPGLDFEGNAALIAQGAHRMWLRQGEAGDALVFEERRIAPCNAPGAAKQMTMEWEAVHAHSDTH